MIIDLFCGAGGASSGVAGVTGETLVGIDWDPNACRVHQAAGHLTVRADVADYPLERFVGKVTGMWASPPCTAFSAAGKRCGEKDKPLIYDCLQCLDTDGPFPDMDFRFYAREKATDARSLLVVEPFRWALALQPEWIACEQVPPVLELWEWMADRLRTRGYSTWAGILNSADYGVPQTRQRAFLMASRVRPAVPPEPTHAKEPQQTLFGPEQQPWVSMAQALGWGYTSRPTTAFCGGNQGGPDLAGGSGARAVLHEARANGNFVMHPDRAAAPPEPDSVTPAEAWLGGLPVEMENQRGAGMLERYGERPGRTPDEPSFTITCHEGGGCGPNLSWTVRTGANTMKVSRDNDDIVPYERSVDEPAPTVDAKVGSAWKVAPEGQHVDPPMSWKLNTGRDWKPGGSREDAQVIDCDTEPAPAVTAKSGGQWQLNPGRTDTQPNRRNYDLDEAAPTIAFGHDAANWAWEQPSTTVAGDPRVSARCHHEDGSQGADARTTEQVQAGDYDGTQPIRLQVWEAAVLQGFNPSYPFDAAGTRTAQFLAVGNAVPPPMAAVVVGSLLGL